MVGISNLGIWNGHLMAEASGGPKGLQTECISAFRIFQSCRYYADHPILLC